MLDFHKLQDRKGLCVLFTWIPLAASKKPEYTEGAQLQWLAVQDMDPSFRSCYQGLQENGRMTQPPQDLFSACCSIKNAIVWT